ncbi:MAG: DHHA1 domain-containing protein [Proteobacteria bacterium]|nr:DHHA1 domain-containing protein [Pseudomonadota bacterium]
MDSATNGQKFKNWISASNNRPNSLAELRNLLYSNRQFEATKSLDYGNYGLHDVLDAIHGAILANKRIALYADYDVDGTMSCVSWIWFFQSIGYTNYTHYIPCRFNEGYGVNLDAIKHLVNEQNADVIITMDTGITANAEAAYCKERNVVFICTDHHKIQPEKMPDCLILNPKMHPDTAYQELCGCGITFVLLRQLARHLEASMTTPVWTDILALTGMATICDVVPLNGVNHKIAKMGVDALMKSERPILKRLRLAAQIEEGDEKDVGFRLGPRINAVGRLEHADIIINAFIKEDPTDLIAFMGLCNERRKKIQTKIVDEALSDVNRFAYHDAPILFLGGDWHPGVVGIAASKLSEIFWKPTWLYQKKDGICKGSARSLKGFDVTDAMTSCKDLFLKFGGHSAAGGFTFPEAHENEIRAALTDFANAKFHADPTIWQSKISYDCGLIGSLLNLELISLLDELKPFGHGFEEPKFLVEGRIKEIRFLNDKLTGNPKHTTLTIETSKNFVKIIFFGTVTDSLKINSIAHFVVSASKNTFRGQTSLQLIGHDYKDLN